MIAKTFEVLDSMTFIPVLAVKLQPGNERDGYLLARSGYGPDLAEYVVVWRLSGGSGHCTYDPYDWSGSRTMLFAHEYILKNFDALESGAVVDVEYILGLTSEPKVSEEERHDRIG